MRFWTLTLWITLLLLGGCGTTRWSDTQRTATEQLLISDAIDRAVSELDCSPVAGKRVFLDAAAVKQTVDAAYLISTVRQQLLASGCIVRDKLDDADYVVEIRAGAVGTDRRDLLFGVPATKVPGVVPGASVASSIPEIPLATKTEQRAVAKIAVFAYNRHTGRPVWQSGVIPVESKIKDLWVLGTGPFQSGSIYKGTKFAGQKVSVPVVGSRASYLGNPASPAVAKEAFYVESEQEVAEAAAKEQKKTAKDAKDTKDAKAPAAGASEGVKPASHSEPAAATGPEAATAIPVPPGPTETSGPRFLTQPLDLTVFGKMMSASVAAPGTSTAAVGNATVSAGSLTNSAGTSAVPAK